MKILHYSIIAILALIVIIGSNAISAQADTTSSPLQQFKSGISLENITCKDGLFLAISSEKNPLCLEPGTISKLASRGFFYGANPDETGPNYSTVLIPPGSENPATNKSYSPNNITVVIGVNSTVRWINQANAGNTIASDMPVVQNLDTFGSRPLRPGDSYQYTFTEPGTFKYHGEPHPWQRGTINVLLIPIQANLTAQQPSTTTKVNNTIFGDFYQGIENDTGTTTIGNQAYYFTTLNDTLSSYHGVAAIPFTFHGIDFTLFPSAFSPGPPGNLTSSCGNTNFSSEVTFTDGTPENLNVQIPGQPCSENYTQTALSNHQNPQAGIQVYQGKIRLLASVGQTIPISNSTSNGPEFKVGPDVLGSIPHQLVFFMKSNSTAKIFVEYTSDEPNTGTMPSYSSVYAYNGTYNPLTAHDVNITEVPSSIPLTEGSNTTVVYTVTAKEGVKGVYWLFLVQFCRVMPLAVDINSSTISPSDIPVQMGMTSCPAQLLDGKILGISGGTVEYKVGQPMG